MIHSSQLQTLGSTSFLDLYEKSYISLHVEQILCLVLEKAFIDKSNILSFDLSNIASCHYTGILEALKIRLNVSSIYINHNTLYVDWSI